MRELIHGKEKSVIDLVMVNEEAYSRYIRMEVDERREIVDSSDHCVISVYFKVRKEERRLNDGVKEKAYYKFTEKRESRFRMQVEEDLQEEEIVSIDSINQR